LVTPDLVDEINVEPPVSVDVRDGQAVAVVIMGGFVGFGAVLHRVLFKADAAFFIAVGELEVVKHFPGFGGLNLLLFDLFEGLEGILVLAEWIDHLLGRRSRRPEYGACGMQNQQHSDGPTPDRKVSIHTICSVHRVGVGGSWPRARRNPTKWMPLEGDIMKR